MATTYPLATLALTITAAGITAPMYADILASLQASFRIIYGEDAYLEPDSQDGQLLAIFAQAQHDTNQAVIAAYNNFSPQTALGVGLSNVVKINHMARLIATKSQVNLLITGQAGTTIENGAAGDSDGGRWLLPTTTIPPGGSITVTATASVVGAITAAPNAVTIILTPTAGWQTVTNAASATPGQPVESDAELRARQEITPALNAYTVLTGLTAAIKALPGVSYGIIYENDTGSTDLVGIPAHSIACVVKGGIAADIARTIYDRKAPGVGTHGTTTVSLIDVSGALRDIKFYVPTEVAIKVAITLVAGDTYTTAIGAEIKAAVAAHINALSIGEDVVVTRLYVPALLASAADGKAYKLTVLQAALHPAGTLATTDIVIAFNQKAICDAANVTLTVV